MVTHLQCLLWGLYREWHRGTAQFVVTNTTATYRHHYYSRLCSDHRGSEALGYGQDEEALCHTWGVQLYLRVQVILEEQTQVNRLLGWLSSPQCSGPSLGWLIPVTPCIGLCGVSHDDSSLIQRQFSKSRNPEEWLNDGHHWAFESGTPVGLFCVYQNSLRRMQEMAEVPFRPGMWRSRGWGEWHWGRTTRKAGAYWLFLSVDCSQMKEHTHWWKTRKPHKIKKKNYHPFVIQVKHNHYPNVSIFLLLLFPLHTLT